jgi:hypothetical protein
MKHNPHWKEFLVVITGLEELLQTSSFLSSDEIRQNQIVSVLIN